MADVNPSATKVFFDNDPSNISDIKSAFPSIETILIDEREKNELMGSGSSYATLPEFSGNKYAEIIISQEGDERVMPNKGITASDLDMLKRWFQLGVFPIVLTLSKL